MYLTIVVANHNVSYTHGPLLLEMEKICKQHMVGMEDGNNGNGKPSISNNKFIMFVEVRKRAGRLSCRTRQTSVNV